MSTIELGGVARQSSRAQVAPWLDARVRWRTRASVAYHADHPEEVAARMRELDREWGVERWLQLNSAVLSLVGLGLAALGRRRWLLVPAVVQAFLAQHAVQGFCPPLLLLRKLGLRTTSEVERERAALKALRGELKRDAMADAPQALRQGSTGEGGQPAKADGHAPSSTASRVPARTSHAADVEIRRQAEQRVSLLGRHPEEIPDRLRALDREWDIERLIQLEAAGTTLTGVALAAAKGGGWLVLPMFAQSMMVLHALHGFYPMLPLFRRLGLRTEFEISAERYALKALRGDFERVGSDPATAPDAAFDAAKPTDG